MANFINTKTEEGIEIVFEFEDHISYSDKQKMLKEYNNSGDGLYYYFSSRSTKHWRES